MLRRQSSSHRSHCIFNPGPISRNHIHKAFHQINLMALLDNRLGLIQMIELVAFIENSGATTVFVLGLMAVSSRLLPNPPGKGHNLPTVIGQGKHNPVLKSIIDQIILCQIEEARVHDGVLIKLASHTLMKIIPLIRSKPDLKMLENIICQPALVEISPRFLSHLGRHQDRMVKLRCLGMDIVESLMRMALSRSVIARCLHSQGNPCPFCYNLHSIHKGNASIILNEFEDIARLAAAKTVIKLLVLYNVKRGRLFAMKGTESQEIPPSLGQGHRFSYDIDDIDAVFNFRNDFFINQETIPPIYHRISFYILY